MFDSNRQYSALPPTETSFTDTPDTAGAVLCEISRSLVMFASTKEMAAFNP